MAFGQLGRAGAAGLSAAGRPRTSPVGRAGQALTAGHPALNLGGIGNAGSALLGAQGLSTVPGATQPAPPTAPAAPSVPPGGSPLDAAYYANVAAHNFQTGNQINALNLRDANNLTSLQATLGNLAYQQPRDQLALEQRANAGGGLYSSVEGQNQANLVRSYDTRQTAAQTGYGQAHSGIASQIAALLAGEPVYATGQAIDAANRAALLAANNPAAGANATPPGSAGAGASSPGGGGGGRGGAGVGRAGGALLGAFGNLIRSPVGRAGQALSNRGTLARALGGRR